jgi:hypothetical protein
MKALLLVALAAGCTGNKTQAAPSERAPAGKLEAITELCVTKGTVAFAGGDAVNAPVTDPTVRAVALASSGDAASMTFTYRGHSEKIKKLASGQERHQLGLKLRAQNGCNLVYVMWRLEGPKGAPMIEVSIKRNPGQRTHAECGVEGYTKVKPTKPDKLAIVPVLGAGDKHTLRATIAGDELRAWIDDKLVWNGALPDSARDLVGRAGIRSDNVAYDLGAFSAPAGDAKGAPKCTPAEGD